MMTMPSNSRTAALSKLFGVHRSTRGRAVGLLGLSVGAVGLVLGLTPAFADVSRTETIGDTTVFASVPAPGHPFGVAVDRDRVFVSTSAGDFFAQHLNSAGERVFAYDKQGRWAAGWKDRPHRQVLLLYDYRIGDVPWRSSRLPATAH